MVISGGARDREVLAEGFARWLRERRPEAAGLAVGAMTGPPAGFSSETLFVDVRWSEGGSDREEALVLRLPPPGEGIFPSYDLARQARVQAALEPTRVPVAPVAAVEEDESWLGATFMVMPKISGRALPADPGWVSEGWLAEAGPRVQARLQEGFLDALAEVHTLDWRALGLDFLVEGSEPGLRSQLAYWRDYLAWAGEGDPPAVLVEALQWCAEHRPSPEPPAALQWGDAQLANLVFDESGAPVAVLDWEMAGLGPAEADLGWFLALNQDRADRKGTLPGFVGRDEAVRHYTQRLGRTPQDLGWYEVYAIVRSGAIMARIAKLLAAQGVDEGWLTVNPLLRSLPDRIGAN